MTLILHQTSVDLQHQALQHQAPGAPRSALGPQTLPTQPDWTQTALGITRGPLQDRDATDLMYPAVGHMAHASLPLGT